MSRPGTCQTLTTVRIIEKDMRVYLPSTLPALARALTGGEVGPAPLVAYAVTPALREWCANSDLEELEYVAMTAAARASLRLLADAPTRRVVLAAEVADDTVAKEPGDLALAGSDRARVRLMSPVPMAKVVSGHVDDHEAVHDVRRAIAALPAADTGDEDAQFTVDSAEGHELMWYATQELPHLLT